MHKPVRKAIFPVGGLGTRFLPATKAMPKEMLPVVDKPLIQYAVEEARNAGIEEFIFVTGRGKHAIEDHFDYAQDLRQFLESRGKRDLWENIRHIHLPPGSTAYTRQPEPLGLGHAVWCARGLIGDEPFAVLLADDLIMADTPCLKQMMDARAETGGNIIAVMEVPEAHTNRYGIVDPEVDGGTLVKVQGVVEKPNPSIAPSRLAIIGRYLLSPDIFTFLDKQKSGAGGEIQLTDAIAETIPTTPLHGLRFDGKRFDCGDKVGFFEANVAFALQHPEMQAEVRQVLGRYCGGAPPR